MLEEYNSKSCNALQKPYYRPIEAAIRWCNLIKHEESILRAVKDELVPGPSLFPQWPCLRANAEIILDATLNQDLPYGRDGRPVNSGEQVAKHRLTIRHSDLKDWMQKRFPDQKPEFLFDEIERNTHSSINKDTYIALQAERDALTSRLEKATECYRTIQQEKKDLIAERDKLKAKIEKSNIPNDRSETTYLNTIAGLLELILCKTSDTKKSHSVFNSQEEIIDSLVSNHQGKPGIAVRTLQEKFAAAKRSLIASE